jgi:hypothetical protein
MTLKKSMARSFYRLAQQQQQPIEPLPYVENLFMIVISADLLDADDSLQTVLNTYVADLTSEGWAPEAITVTSSNQVNADHVVQNCAQLKQILTTHYNRGMKGLVLIGEDGIPVAGFQRTRGTSDHNDFDLYYADYTHPWVSGSRLNSFCYYDEQHKPIGSPVYTPDIIFGRIPTYVRNSAPLSDWSQAQFIKKYLNRIHNYRVNGASERIQDRNAYFSSWEWVSKDSTRGLLRSATEMYHISDYMATGEDGLKNMLSLGAKVMHINCHGFPTGWQTARVKNYDDYLNNSKIYGDVTITYLRMPENKIKALYLTAMSCNFAHIAEESMTNTMFHESDDLLNILGDSEATGYGIPPIMWEGISTKTIGETFNDFLVYNSRFGDGQALNCQFVFFGDPALRYQNVGESSQDRSPYIPRRIRNLRAYYNKQFNLFIPTVPTTGVTVSIEGMPSNATLTGNKFSITPTFDNMMDNKYPMTIVLEDTEGRKYKEEVVLWVSQNYNIQDVTSTYVTNADFETTAGWNVTRYNNTLYTLASVSNISGAQSKCLKITHDDNKGWFEIYKELPVLPGGDYEAVVWVKTENLAAALSDANATYRADDHEANGVLFYVEGDSVNENGSGVTINNWANSVREKTSLGTNDWIQLTSYFSINTGSQRVPRIYFKFADWVSNHTAYPAHALESLVTGIVYVDNLKLFKRYQVEQI